MKKKLLNSMRVLLVAALLGGASSAWAETGSATVKMTYVNGSSDAQSTSYGDLALSTEILAGYLKISSGSLTYANQGWGVNNIIYLQVDASAIEGTITGATLSATLGSNSSRGLTYGVGYNSSAWSSTLTWATADRSITTCGSTVSVAKNATASTQSFDITDALRNDADKIVTILVYQTAAGGGNFSNPAVSITYTTAAAANYTIKYVAEIDGVETELKTARTETGIVGENGAITESDQASITYNDWKYLYDSNNASTTIIANDGTSVVKVVFRAAAKKNYTVTSTYKDAEENSYDLAWTSSGYIWEDETTANIYFPFYQLYNGNTLVTRDRVSNELKYTATINNDGDEVNIEYKAAGIDNIYLLSEAEDLGTDLTQSATTFTNRISNHKIIYGASGTLLSLPAGKYIVTLCVAGKPNNGNTTYQAFAGSEQIITDYNSAGNYINNAVSSEFTIYGTTPITFTCAGSSTDRGIDIVYVQKTGDVELPASVSATIGDAGWATLYTKYDLDFSGVTGLEAYTAAVADGKVTLTKVDNVPANTGVVLKGAGNYNIPVIASSETAKGDLLGSATDATAYNAIDGYTLYMLKKVGEKAQFVPVTGGEIAAGKAYLKVANATTARNLDVTFADEATGIESVKNEGLKVKSEVYNLKGQRVSDPTKGLYIVNGKKIAIK